MNSQPIMVPRSDQNRKMQSESHSTSVGNIAGENWKMMTPPEYIDSVATEDRRSRRGSNQVPILAKPPSSESLLANSTTWVDAPGPPLSPGLTSSLSSGGGENSPKVDGDKVGDSSCKLTRKESYKAQRKNYRMEKKRVADELLNSLKDPTVIVMSDWLKVRGTLKSWTKLWCILKPGLLLLYKSPKMKSNHWVGTVLLNICQVIERPSKKDGFCFKLFHPLEQSIWAPRGPENEAIGAVVQPLPTSYLIFRAPSQAAGKCWLDALELSLRCSSLIIRSASVLPPRSPQHDTTTTHETQWSEADYEKHFIDHAAAAAAAATTTTTGATTATEYNRTTRSPEYRQRLRLRRRQRVATSTGCLLEPPSIILSCNSSPSCVKASRSLRSSSGALRSLCPPSTPVFQQLYDAVGYWERLLGASPQHDSVEATGPSLSSASESQLAEQAGQAAVGLEESARRRMTLPADPHNHLVTLDHALYDSLPVAATAGDALGSLGPSLDDDVSTPTADLDDCISQPENGLAADHEMSPTDTESEEDNKEDAESREIKESVYQANENEILGSAGEVVTELQEEQKSLIWFLMKQVRPGMDLSKVVLPTFILEPRSFLEKLADSYYHADLLSQAVLEDDAFTRMKGIVKWYLSGFYKKPQGLKKPYNPLLGETFRCYWQHPNGSRTFYLAEQVSHHPPISSFYVTNRQDGFTIGATIVAKSKFYGNSTSAVLDGAAVLTMLPRGEDYTMTIPYAHCKGILMGTLSMELGGKVNITCEKTGYHTELEFKLKPFLGGSDQLNMVVGRIKLGKETLANISGYWDGQITITDKRTGQDSVLFNPTPEVRKSRLKKYTVPLEHQSEWESEKLWLAVTQAINNEDQTAATEAKTALEEAQRERAKERKAQGQEWLPKYFVQDIISGNWIYRHADIRPWDPRNDLVQYEHDYIVSTKTRHKTPIMRTGSIVSMEPQSQLPLLLAESRSSLSVLKSSKRQLTNNHPITEAAHDSASSSEGGHSDSSQSVGKRRRSTARIVSMVKSVESRMQSQAEKLDHIQRLLEQMSVRQRQTRERANGLRLSKHFIDTIIIVFVVFIAQYVMRL
ncbi:oxysterol-binding protein-related protein 8 isoform X2 [Phymastichus coffea]|uniref:oxysterol-binding protein-related protein 8 isoform X2 n=1 Tax=Phymastichus coffea TaxID=108790 RepID=UPI00273B15D8|nr:oxysterol-binding protein-related protein 8 isoform X2 [Phymastichus coffea]